MLLDAKPEIEPKLNRQQNQVPLETILTDVKVVLDGKLWMPLRIDLKITLKDLRAIISSP